MEHEHRHVHTSTTQPNIDPSPTRLANRTATVSPRRAHAHYHPHSPTFITGTSLDGQRTAEGGELRTVPRVAATTNFREVTLEVRDRFARGSRRRRVGSDGLRDRGDRRSPFPIAPYRPYLDATGRHSAGPRGTQGEPPCQTRTGRHCRPCRRSPSRREQNDERVRSGIRWAVRRQASIVVEVTGPNSAHRSATAGDGRVRWSACCARKTSGLTVLGQADRRRLLQGQVAEFVRLAF